MKNLGLLMAALLISSFAGGDAMGQVRGWHGGGYRGWYGWGGGVYFGGPLWWGAYPYPLYYPPPGYSAYPGHYAYSGSYPYPLYVEPGPAIYIQRPPVVVMAPPAPALRTHVPRFERYRLSARELFAFDRADLAAPQPRLDEIAVALVRNPQITGIMISGYTDRLGSVAYNLTLSQRRADAVKAYLVGKGVAANRLIAVGKGEASPVARCGETAHAALIACLEPNRRVEIEQITIERPIG